MSNSTEKDNTLMIPPMGTRRENKREGKHSQDELHEEPDEPKHDKPCERERIRERENNSQRKKRDENALRSESKMYIKM